MSQTLYASFQDAQSAEKAAGALLDYGADKDDLSILLNDEAAQTRYSEAGNYYGSEDAFAESGDRAAAAASSANLGGHTSSGQYATAADARALGAGFDDGSTTVVDRADVDEMDEEDDSVYADNGAIDRAAKGGISTTTAGDAGSGAAKGAGIGLGVGILAGLASLFVPGVGMVVGGGALATAIGGAIGTMAAGAVAGGATGYLKDQGVSDEAARNYSEALGAQGAVVALTIPSGNVNEGIAREVVSKYGGGNIEVY